MTCKVCGNSERNRVFVVREMMFGREDDFLYFECNHCKCLQINEYPDYLKEFYPAQYYSFKPIDEKMGVFNGLSIFLTRSRNRYYFFRNSILGKIVHMAFPNHRLFIISLMNLNKQSRVLDVGCGNGLLLYHMKDVGFLDLLGIDPFLDHDLKYNNGLLLQKRPIEEMSGEYDLVMFHHSFEHMANPEVVLQKVHSLLSDGGRCLIRVPTTSSYAWRHYGVDWVQIDAPRHFFLHSKESIAYLADKIGLHLERIVYDSTAFQFWGSEQHKLGIPLFSENSYMTNRTHSNFTKRQIKRYAKEAKRLNKLKMGDTCAFILRKAESSAPLS